MTAGIGFQTESGYVWERTEELRRAADWLKKGAHLRIGGLPGSGKSTFVRQLISADVRDRLGLDRQYLMVLLDGSEFTDLPRESIWGAISRALKDAYRLGEAQVCSGRGVQQIDFCELTRIIRSLREYKIVLALDHCSSLCATGDCIADSLLHLSKKRFLSLVAIPTLPYASLCAGEESDQFVPMNLPLLSPEQARDFLTRALPALGLNEDLTHNLRDSLVAWVGGDLSLLDSACDLEVKLRENYRDVVMLYHWPPRHKWKDLREQGYLQNDDRFDYLEFRRILGELCSLDAQLLYSRRWDVLSEREQAILLALNELQRIDPLWQEELERLSRRGLLQRQANHYLLFPKLWDDYVSGQPDTRGVGPFSFNLKDIQTVYVHGERCELSTDQAGIFLRLFLQQDRPVPYARLYADLYASYGDKLDRLSPFCIEAVDLEIEELRRALSVGPEVIERIPPDRGALHNVLDGYRLAISSDRSQRLVAYCPQ